MSKKTFLCLALLLTVISLIYMILSHYEFTRYLKLRSSGVESYVANYTKIPKADKNKVVVVFTATEDQLKKIRPFINSILDQTVRVDEIVLVIPYPLSDKVPEESKKVLSVRGYSKDYDDASHLVSSVLSEPEADTKIILVEPYMVYGKYFIQNMVEKSDENPDKLVYGDKKKDKQYGILIKPKFFDEGICEYQKGKGFTNWLNTCCKKGFVTINSENTYRG